MTGARHDLPPGRGAPSGCSSTSAAIRPRCSCSRASCFRRCSSPVALARSSWVLETCSGRGGPTGRRCRRRCAGPSAAMGQSSPRSTRPSPPPPASGRTCSASSPTGSPTSSKRRSDGRRSWDSHASSSASWPVLASRRPLRVVGRDGVILRLGLTHDLIGRRAGAKRPRCPWRSAASRKPATSFASARRSGGFEALLPDTRAGPESPALLPSSEAAAGAAVWRSGAAVN